MKLHKKILSSILIFLTLFLNVSTISAESDGSIISVINKVSPSVVGIIGNLKEDSPDYTPGSENMASGTGVIIKSNGYIITNAHVVKDLENIFVILSNHKAYEAKLKALDEKTDLALIKIDKGLLTPVKFGKVSDIRVGQTVIAIGNPLSLSLQNSATKGMISGLNRSIQSDYRFIQSDAAINGGNSGGPLVNLEGKVIGINSIKYTGYGIESMSFSIPVDTVQYAVSQFEKFGEIKRPYIGAAFIEGIAARYGLPSSEGITVSEVTKDSPASKYKLFTDDILTGINGISITSMVDLNEALKKFLPGNKVVLSIRRNDQPIKITLVLGTTPKTK